MKPILALACALTALGGSGALGAEPGDFSLLETLRFPTPGSRVAQLEFSPDGKRIVALSDGISRTDPNSHLITVWDAKSGERRWSGQIADPSFSPDHPELAAVVGVAVERSNVLVQFRSSKVLAFDLETGKARSPTPDANDRAAGIVKRLPPETVVDISVDRSLVAYSTFPRSNLTPERPREAVVIFSAATGSQIARLEEPHGYANWLSLSPDGRALAVGRSDGRVSVWNVAEKRKTFNVRGEDGFGGWSADGSRLLTWGSGHSTVWNAPNGAVIRRLASSGRGAISPDGALVALDGTLGSLEMYRVSDGERVGRAGALLNAVRFNADGSRMLLGFADGRAQWRSLETPQRVQGSFDFGEPTGLIGFTATDKALFTAYDTQQRAFILDLMTTQTSSLPPLEIPEQDARGNENPRTIGPVVFGNNGPLAIVDEQAARDVDTISRSETCADRDPSPSPDARTVLCLSRGKLTLLERASGKPIWTRAWSEDTTWSPDGTLLVSAWLGNKVVIMDARTGKTKVLLEINDIDPHKEGEPRSFTFSPDSQVLRFRTSFGPNRFFDLRLRRELSVPNAWRDAPEVQFTPDGRFVSLRFDEELQLWGPPDRRPAFKR